MTKIATTPETRRAKSLSPDILEVLNMLSALENQPRRTAPASAKE